MGSVHHELVRYPVDLIQPDKLQILLWDHYHVSDGRDYDYLGLFFYPISELLDYVVAFLFLAGFSEDDMRDFILMYQVYQGIQDIVGTDYGKLGAVSHGFFI